jgi:anthranilate phosphoribosyltransferase
VNASGTPNDGTFTWSQVIADLMAGRDLSDPEAIWALREVMSGSASPAQIAGFLVALRCKGVTGRELAALVSVMVENSVAVQVADVVVDTCGTGGDNSGSVNISTMAAIAVAATGASVVKHGNRAATSKSGSADVLEALGVVVDLAPELIGPCVDRAGIAFCFAPVFHPSMRHAGPVRRELGIPTVFNALGPLANPALPRAQVVGVADRTLAPTVADALNRRGTSALVVRGEDGLDELTTMAATRVWDCRGPVVEEFVIEPEDLGLSRAKPGALDGGDARHNAKIAREALSQNPSAEVRAVQDAVVLNAAAALVCIESVGASNDGDLLTDLRQAMQRVKQALDAGKGTFILDRWVEVSSELSLATTES